MTLEQLEEIQRYCDLATPGPWEVWDGPAYYGGGKDLCLGSAFDGRWIVNVDHREGPDHEARVDHDSAGCDKPADACPICSINVDVTREQACNANFIARARTDLPRTLWYLRQAMEAARDAQDCAERLYLKLKDLKACPVCGAQGKEHIFKVENEAGETTDDPFLSLAHAVGCPLHGMMQAAFDLGRLYRDERETDAEGTETEAEKDARYRAGYQAHPETPEELAFAESTAADAFADLPWDEADDDEKKEPKA